MTTTSYARRSRVTIACMVLSLPVLGYGARRTLQVNANSPLDWMPPSFAARVDYERFCRLFENGDVTVASWPNCKLDDPRLDRAAERLSTSTAACDADGRPYFERILTSSGIVRELTAPPLSLPRSEAVDRLRGSLVGRDGESACVVIVFTPTGRTERARAVELLRTALVDCGVPYDDQRLAGPIIDGLSVDVASHEALARYAAPSSAIIFLLTALCLRSWRAALPVFLTSAYCQLASLALVNFCGDSMNAVLIVMPPLVLVLGVSGGIHLVNYLYDAVRHGGLEGCAARAVRLGRLPCFLSSGTTAVGLGSLLVSDVVPIREFGFYGAFGVSLTFVLLFLVVPGVFEMFPSTAEASGGESSDASAQGTAHRPQLRLAALVARRPAWITATTTIILVAGVLGVPKIRTSVRIQTLFAPESRILADYAWLEERVVPLVPIEVVLHCDASCRAPTSERLRIVQAIERRLARLPSVRSTMSTAAFAPTQAAIPGSARDTVRQAVVRRKLESAVPRWIEVRYLHEDGAAQAWRITARVGALEEIDYGRFLDEARAAVEPILAEERTRGVAGLSAEYTGVMPLVHEVQRALLHDLFNSFLSALAVITLTMIWVQRSVGAGLVAMIPNVFPIVLLFGALGWLGRPMDIGSVMTAGIALGMAIDGTLHFLTFYRRDIARTDSPVAAVRAAFVHCAGAMTESTVVCGFGLATFALSSFLPTSRFAWMILWLLWAALVGDLIVLPALLLGACGKYFRRRSQPTEEFAPV